jgi:hypothetical protein
VNPSLNGNRNHFRDAQGNAPPQPLPSPTVFWTPADVTNLVATVLKAIPQQAGVTVKVNGKHVETSKGFAARAEAVRKLRKAGPLPTLPKRAARRRAKHVHSGKKNRNMKKRAR